MASPPPGTEILKTLQQNGFSLLLDQGNDIITFRPVRTPLTPTEFAQALEKGRYGLFLGREDELLSVSDLGEVQRIAALHGHGADTLDHPETGRRLRMLDSSGWSFREVGHWNRPRSWEQSYQIVAGSQSSLQLTAPEGREMLVTTPDEVVLADFLYASGEDAGLPDPQLARRIKAVVPADHQLEAWRLMGHGMADPEGFGRLCRRSGPEAAETYRRLSEAALDPAELVRGVRLAAAAEDHSERSELTDYLSESLPQTAPYAGGRRRRLEALERLVAAGSSASEAVQATELCEIQLSGTEHGDRLKALERLVRARGGTAGDVARDYEALLKYRDQDLPQAAAEYSSLLASLGTLDQVERAPGIYARIQEGRREGGSLTVRSFLEGLALTGSVERAFLVAPQADPGPVIVDDESVQVGGVRLPRRSSG